MKRLPRLSLLATAFLSLSPLAFGQGFLGVSMNPTEEGPEIVAVIPGSAAEAAGLQPGDRIVRIGGRAVESFEDVATVIREHEPGDTLTVVVQRGDERVRVRARLGAPPEGEEEVREVEEMEEIEEVEEAEEPPGGHRAWFGITIAGTEDEELRIGSVSEGSPAARAGVRAGDRIVRAGDRPGSDLAEIVAGMKPGQPLRVKVLREDGEDEEFVVVLGERPGTGEGQSAIVVGPDGSTLRVVPPGRFRLDVPDAESRGGTGIRLVPELRGRLPVPRAEARGLESIPPDEIRALREEIRSLRDEVRALRALVERQRGGTRGAFLLRPDGELQPLDPSWGLPGGTAFLPAALAGAEGDECCCDECGCDCDHEEDGEDDEEEEDDDDDCCCEDCGEEECEGHEVERPIVVSVPY